MGYVKLNTLFYMMWFTFNQKAAIFGVSVETEDNFMKKIVKLDDSEKIASRAPSNFLENYSNHLKKKSYKKQSITIFLPLLQKKKTIRLMGAHFEWNYWMSHFIPWVEKLVFLKEHSQRVNLS